MRIFFSLESDSKHPITQACKSLGHELIQSSLLSYTPVEGKPQKAFDIIFFSSPRAYQYGKHLLKANTKIACVSKGTANYIEQPIAWQGNSPGDPKQTAQSFKHWVGKQRVLFPVSDRSLGSIAKLFPPQQIECITVYQTHLIAKEIVPCDCYIFTSPSNVAAFLMKNKMPKNAKIIAWGQSTYQFLKDNGIDAVFYTEENKRWEEALSFQ